MTHGDGNGDRQRILILDDNVLLLRALRRELRDAFDIVEVSTFAEALEQLGEHDFAAVVSDWFLGPGPDGLDFLDRVRTQRPKTVRVLASGTMENRAIAKALASGIVHRFVEKPWDRGEIVAAVLAALKSLGEEE